MGSPREEFYKFIETADLPAIKAKHQQVCADVNELETEYDNMRNQTSQQFLESLAEISEILNEYHKQSENIECIAQCVDQINEHNDVETHLDDVTDQYIKALQHFYVENTSNECLQLPEKLESLYNTKNYEAVISTYMDYFEFIEHQKLSGSNSLQFQSLSHQLRITLDDAVLALKSQKALTLNTAKHLLKIYDPNEILDAYIQHLSEKIYQQIKDYESKVTKLVNLTEKVRKEILPNIHTMIYDMNLAFKDHVSNLNQKVESFVIAQVTTICDSVILIADFKFDLQMILDAAKDLRNGLMSLNIYLGVDDIFKQTLCKLGMPLLYTNHCGAAECGIFSHFNTFVNKYLNQNLLLVYDICVENQYNFLNKNYANSSISKLKGLILQCGEVFLNELMYTLESCKETIEFFSESVVHDYLLEAMIVKLSHVFDVIQELFIYMCNPIAPRISIFKLKPDSYFQMENKFDDKHDYNLMLCVGIMLFSWLHDHANLPIKKRVMLFSKTVKPPDIRPVCDSNRQLLLRYVVYRMTKSCNQLYEKLDRNLICTAPSDQIIQVFEKLFLLCSFFQFVTNDKYIERDNADLSLLMNDRHIDWLHKSNSVNLERMFVKQESLRKAYNTTKMTSQSILAWCVLQFLIELILTLQKSRSPYPWHQFQVDIVWLRDYSQTYISGVTVQLSNQINFESLDMQQYIKYIDLNVEDLFKVYIEKVPDSARFLLTSKDLIKLINVKTIG